MILSSERCVDSSHCRVFIGARGPLPAWIYQVKMTCFLFKLCLLELKRSRFCDSTAANIEKCTHNTDFVLSLSLVEHVADLPSHQRGRWQTVCGSESASAGQSTSWPEDSAELRWGQVFPHRSTWLSRRPNLRENCAEWVFTIRHHAANFDALLCNVFYDYK